MGIEFFYNAYPFSFEREEWRPGNGGKGKDREWGGDTKRM